jgi:prepilin-type N-terminal cleavage/methylation domain-containing protein
MQKNHGFSLIEVLVSLFLVASISLLLLKQQWHSRQLLQQVINRYATITQTDNELERKQHGFGILELFISLMLSCLLISGLIQQYIQIKRQVIFVEKQISTEDDLELISQLMRTSIRKAGFTPCSAINNLTAFDSRSSRNNLLAVEARHDEINISRMSDNFTSNFSYTNSKEIMLLKNFTTKKIRQLMIADCYHAEVQNIDVVKNDSHGILVRFHKPLKFSYKPPIYIGEWVEESFFIKTNQRGIKSLYYKSHHTDELSSLVHEILIKLQQNLGHMLVTTTLKLDGGLTRDILTSVRAS